MTDEFEVMKQYREANEAYTQLDVAARKRVDAWIGAWGAAPNLPDRHTSNREKIAAAFRESAPRKTSGSGKPARKISEKAFERVLKALSLRRGSTVKELAKRSSYTAAYVRVIVNGLVEQGKAEEMAVKRPYRYRLAQS